MNIGDILTRKPSICGQRGFEDTTEMPCRAIYIHPQRRFYTVEFQNGDYTWRETFYFKRRPNRTEAKERPHDRRYMPRHYGRSI